MEIDYLREFIELSRVGSFTRAASRLGVSRSTLSKHISAVEREFGVTVFERDNLHTELTPAGKLLLGEAQSLLASWEAAHAVLDVYRRSRPMKLRVGVFRGYKPIDDLVETVAGELRRGGVPVEVEIGDIVKPCFDALREHEIDFAPPIFPDGMDLAGLAETTLFEEPVVAIVSSEHPLAARDVISPQDVTGNVVWVIRDGAIRHYSDCIEQLLERKGAKPRYIPTPYTDWKSYSQAFAGVNSGLYITFASTAKFAVPLTSTNYKVLPFDDPEMRVAVRGVWRADDDNPALKMFVDGLLGICSRVDLSVYWR